MRVVLGWKLGRKEFVIKVKISENFRVEFLVFYDENFCLLDYEIKNNI